MTTIRSCLTASSSDLLAQNQTSNVVYPVRPHKMTNKYCTYDNGTGFSNVSHSTELSGGLTG